MLVDYVADNPEDDRLEWEVKCAVEDDARLRDLVEPSQQVCHKLGHTTVSLYSVLMLLGCPHPYRGSHGALEPRAILEPCRGSERGHQYAIPTPPIVMGF